MANKRNQPKPGSRTRYRIDQWDSVSITGETFHEMTHRLEKESKKSYTRIGGPMGKRKAAALLYIQSKGGGGTHERNIERDLLEQLVKDGDIVRKRETRRISGWGKKNYTTIIATSFPPVVAERVSVPYARRKAELMDAGLHYSGRNQKKVRVDTQTEMWTREKDEKLFFEQLAGRADPELVKEVGRIKTKMRKIRKK